MSKLIGGMFNFADRLQMESLNLRQTRSHVIASNITNAETPGFRAIGFDFEEQLQALSGANEPIAVKVNHPKHLRNSFTEADGTMQPEVFVRPTESIGQDGNTVDLDVEMAQLAENQILYRSAIEVLNKKMGTLRYAINGGR